MLPLLASWLLVLVLVAGAVDCYPVCMWGLHLLLLLHARCHLTKGLYHRVVCRFVTLTDLLACVLHLLLLLLGLQWRSQTQLRSQQQLLLQQSGALQPQHSLLQGLWPSTHSSSWQHSCLHWPACCSPRPREQPKTRRVLLLLLLLGGYCH